MSHPITQPAAARWAEYYLVELLAAGATVALALVLVPMAVIAVRDACRLTSNARVRRRASRRRALAAVEAAEVEVSA